MEWNVDCNAEWNAERNAEWNADQNVYRNAEWNADQNVYRNAEWNVDPNAERNADRNVDRNAEWNAERDAESHLDQSNLDRFQIHPVPFMRKCSHSFRLISILIIIAPTIKEAGHGPYVILVISLALRHYAKYAFRLRDILYASSLAHQAAELRARRDNQW